jgi:peptidyl-prolyl cis-trans isomerase C
MRNLMAAASVAGLLAGAPVFAQAPDAATVLATVDGTEITLGQVVAASGRMGDQMGGMPDDALLESMLQQMVDQALLARTVSSSIEDDPLAVTIELENGRRGLLAGSAIEAMLADPIAEEDLRAAYDESIAALEPAVEYSAAHILVASEDEANAIAARVEAGEAFADLASEASLDPGSGPQGGDLGWFALGQMVPEFEQAVVEAEPGKLTAPVESQFGWHLILVNETRDVPPPAFEDVRGDIEAALRNEQIRERIEDLRAAATIEILDVELPEGAIRDATILAD